MRQYGWTEQQLAKVAAKSFYNASLNPNAEYQQAYTVEEVLQSRVVSYPLTRLMCCSARVDGAAAVIVCAREAVEKYTSRRPLVDVAACVHRSVPFYDFRNPEAREDCVYPRSQQRDGGVRDRGRGTRRHGARPVSRRLFDRRDDRVPGDGLLRTRPRAVA